jgi:hypothetical protein
VSLQPIASDRYDEEKDINELIDEVSATTYMEEYRESSPEIEAENSVGEIVDNIYFSNL